MAIAYSRWIRVLLVVMAIALSACSPTQFRTSAAEVPQLVQAILSDPKTFNYALSQETPNIFGLTYKGLIETNGLTGEIEPGLAQSWQISNQGKRIIFTLREDLQWSDGSPLTTDDVVFSYNDVYLNEAIPTSARFVLMIGESRALPTVRKLDDRRVEFTIPEPFAPFLRSTGLPILPAHVLKPTIETQDSEGNPVFLSTWGTDTPVEQIVVNGPYQLERYNTTQRVIFKRNPYYWKKDEGGDRLPNIDRIIWQIVESTDTSFLQFRSGSLDLVDVSPEYFSLLKKEEDRGKFIIHGRQPTLSSVFITFNLNKASRDGKPLVDPIKSRWFNNLKFRQAVAYALDRQTMVNNIYRGLGEPQYSNIPVQSPYYFSPEEGLKIYKFNQEKAQSLLEEAGFQYNSTGQLEDDAGNLVRFTLLTNAGNKIREALGVQIKQDLSKIGIQVDFQPIAFSTLVDKLGNTLDWDAHIIGFAGGGVEPNNSANVWSLDGSLHSFNQQPQPGQPPIQGWKPDPWEQKIADLYIQGAQELEESKRRQIYGEVQQLVKENLPYIYLVNQLSMTAVRDRIQPIQYSALGGALWNLDELQIVDE
ncbi:MAG: ABC transporter substrate-binding protein [Roseofilum sp. SBFL]|uniref:ABC transporter substrate-binding protein n=1 Tax=unclassified Roseofilum TaxID=2620099 RepID=UPI001B19F61E|nr:MULTISPECIES: ABC transporter substrate-binding protein [unclassified Roseofilum]MBP0012752.1 ABC transporter substrate-binding protein [Roseofilum sp. SID3]MBP0037092.1 ABC transporter substrate-binding protein [Roseofilum sp. SID1]MBP0043506.1 ABC transporter substrate-binding protein [Roseofilum sp. SBFL]